VNQNCTLPCSKVTPVKLIHRAQITFLPLFQPRLKFQIHTNQQQSDGHKIVGYKPHASCVQHMNKAVKSHFFGLAHRQYPKPETLTCNLEKCNRGHAMPSDGNCYGCQETCRGKYTGMSVMEDISSVYQFTGHTEGHTYQDRIMKHCHPKYVCLSLVEPAQSRGSTHKSIEGKTHYAPKRLSSHEVTHKSLLRA
jgi:hypothetical protein